MHVRELGLQSADDTTILSEGDVITVVFGDTSHGSPRMRMQTLAEAAFECKVLADVCAVGNFHPIPNRRRSLGDSQFIQASARSGVDRDSLRWAVERHEFAAMRHEANARCVSMSMADFGPCGPS